MNSGHGAGNLREETRKLEVQYQCFLDKVGQDCESKAHAASSSRVPCYCGEAFEGFAKWLKRQRAEGGQVGIATKRVHKGRGKNGDGAALLSTTKYSRPP